jgi:hypothetical protein
MKICAFLWSYYGYPTTTYEGVNVEVMRYENGRIMARNDVANGFDIESVDYIGGVPDSGTPHAIGYSNEIHRPFARAFIKYTPTWARSFMPVSQTERNEIAKMKQGAILVNVARGAVTDEEALTEAIEQGRLGGLGVDVYSREPFPADHPFNRILDNERVCLTPHMAWGSSEARARCISVIANNIRSFARGDRNNRVD